MADYADRSLRIGYVGGSILLFTLLMIALGMWRISVGSVSFNNIVSPKVEIFYWVTILFSNTLGTALGDFFAADSGLGYEGAAVAFRWRISASRGRLLLHEDLSYVVVLVGVHPHSASRCGVG
jgi:uncharacterized membrane-anchored protein